MARPATPRDPYEVLGVSRGADDTLPLPFERRPPDPTSPGSSVATFTKTQFRISALTTTVLTSVIFIRWRG